MKKTYICPQIKHKEVANILPLMGSKDFTMEAESNNGGTGKGGGMGGGEAGDGSSDGNDAKLGSFNIWLDDDF